MPLTLTHLAPHFAVLDGSASISADKDHLFAASDEDNVLCLRATAGGERVPVLNLNDDPPEVGLVLTRRSPSPVTRPMPSRASKKRTSSLPRRSVRRSFTEYPLSRARLSG